MPPRSTVTHTLALSVLLVGCLDFKSQERRRLDAGDLPDADLTTDDAGPVPESDGGDPQIGDPNDLDAMVGDDAELADGGEPDADSEDAAQPTSDGGTSDDGGLEDVCPADVCPAEFPCVGNARDFTCRGQFADFPLPIRRSGETAAAQSLRVERDVVGDEATGLGWQRQVYGLLTTHAQAVTYCDELTLGALSDWRLPSVHELTTLLGHAENPDADTRFFLGLDDQTYHTSTPDSESVAGFWALRFGDGNTFPTDETFPGYLICVRTERALYTGTAASRFVASEAGALVRDTRTKLYWEANISIARTRLTYAQAADYCGGLQLGGRKFRVPSLAELFSLVDYSRPHDRRVPPGFTIVDGFYYWSTTTFRAPDTAFHVTLGSRGDSRAFDASDSAGAQHGVRCVSPE